MQLAVGQVTAEQAGVVAKYSGGAVPTDDERIVVSAGIIGAARLMLVRLDQSGPSWYLGPVEGTDANAYNMVTAGDLRGGRPDLSELLRLPIGFLAVIGGGGIEAVFDPWNQNVLIAD